MNHQLSSGVNANKKLQGEGHKRGWPSFIQIDEAVKEKVQKLFGGYS